MLKNFTSFYINNETIHDLNYKGTLWAPSIVTTFAPSED